MEDAFGNGQVITGYLDGNSYLVLDFIGQGSHGAVYRVKDMNRDHPFPLALKIGLANQLHREYRMLCSAAEVEALAATVPQLVDYDVYYQKNINGPALGFIVREYIAGLSWAQLPPASNISKLAIEAENLDNLLGLWWQHGYFLGDLKPEHLINDRDGRLRVIDQGGIVPLGAEIFNYTPPLDREAWGLGDGIADEGYALMVRNLLLYCRYTGKLPAQGQGLKDYQQICSVLPDIIRSPSSLFIEKSSLETQVAYL